MKNNILYILLILITSCKHNIHEGVIIEKKYEPPRHYTYTTMIKCGSVFVPQIHKGYDDEDWIISVKGINGKDTIIEDFYINKSDWKCLNIGNIFNDSIPCTTTDK